MSTPAELIDNVAFTMRACCEVAIVPWPRSEAGIIVPLAVSGQPGCPDTPRHTIRNMTRIAARAIRTTGFAAWIGRTQYQQDQMARFKFNRA